MRARRRQETIVVADPAQRLAAWLEVDAMPDGDAKLEVTVTGTRKERREFRQRLEAIASGRPTKGE